LTGRGKKAADDVFVVGTGELRLANRHADVRFQTMRGTSDVASFLIAYILGAPEQTQRQWHVFIRVKNEPEADQFLAELRRQYDADGVPPNTGSYASLRPTMTPYSAQSTQSTIASIYGAKTTRRC
jgi:hypothetical protein